MLQVKLPVAEKIHPQSNKFATGVENKGTGDSKLNDSPGRFLPSVSSVITCTMIFNNMSVVFLAQHVIVVMSRNVPLGSCLQCSV